MAKLVTLTIDGTPVEVPEGTVIVDAAKKAGIDIPVFCYHPKMEPVGMCRMCLVEIGRPVIDRATGQPVLDDDGKPKIQFGPKLETACTTPVSPGMVVLGSSEKAAAGRKDILEFLLTSHPLDCPVCDKGGECPLQNLTMGYGPGQSRYFYDEKKHFSKQVPLGELIVLDRERCIQCARCVRFQDVIAGDPVIGFFQRGRSLEIVTCSEPGFNSYWSGNTTDICPVGALTTSDFRFRARAWELRSSASICNQCPVGCNITFNVRREATSGGDWVIKRVMPRQNETVNEIWICDKGRFGYHFASQSKERLNQPLVRKNGELKEATWEEAFSTVAEHFREAGKELLTLAGGRLANEDLFNLGKLTHGLDGTTALYTSMAGGDLVAQYGFSPESNFSEFGPGDAILVVGSDLEEEAPLWWLRIRQAAKRGASVIVLNSRSTKLDRDAAFSIRVPFGAASAAVLAMVSSMTLNQGQPSESGSELSRSHELRQAAQAFKTSKNAVVLFGSDGMGAPETAVLAQVCVNLLLATDHVGRPNNGLIGVWPRANDQGAWELGWKPVDDLMTQLNNARALYLVAADPVGDDPAFLPIFGGQKFVVVQDIFLTQTARLADVVLPAQTWTEREGTYVSGERRVQRFFPALPATTVPPAKVEAPGTRQANVLTGSTPVLEGPQADYSIPARIAKELELPGLVHSSASAVFLAIASEVPVFKGLDYQKVSLVHEQWPLIGREDVYYGGTSYQNSQGLGAQLPLAKMDKLSLWPNLVEHKMPMLGLMAFPITRLYDRGTTLMPSSLLIDRIGEPYLVINAADAGRLKIGDGSNVRIVFGGSGQNAILQARLDNDLPERIALIPRSFGLPISGPTLIEIKPAV